MKDQLCASLLRVIAPALRYASFASPECTQTGKVLNSLGLELYTRHYYHPFIVRSDLQTALTTKRKLPGINYDLTKQKEFVFSLQGFEELNAFIDADLPGELEFDYRTAAFGAGDADVFYGVIRKYKPSTIIEIGCGSSSKLVGAAIAQNMEERSSASTHHVCIEPYEQQWLEKLGAEVVRSRIEECNLDIFKSLGDGDILFIDSNHIIRPQGDVLFEVLEILPTLAPGVFVHFHDIFSPRDYPDEWVFERKLLWNEQYLVEAFLSFNSEFEICVSLNWLTNEIREELTEKLPGLRWNPDAQPGSLWIRRK